MNGLINLLKEPGCTSHDLVARLRKLLHTQKIGHAGTLDPGAAGVLMILVGQGTRVAEYLLDKEKCYRAELTLGISTDTADGGGRVIGRQPVSGLSRERIEEVLSGLRGTIDQVPPMYSALHHHGERLYQLARQGKEVERRARRVSVRRLEMLRYDGRLPYPRLMLDIECSSGTYIRSIATDIGTRLGCGAYMSFLVRTACGGLKLADSMTYQEIGELWEQGDSSFLLPIDHQLQHIPALTVKEQAVRGLVNGMPLALSGINGGVGSSALPGLVRLYAPGGRFLAMGSMITQPGGRIICQPEKVFTI